MSDFCMHSSRAGLPVGGSPDALLKQSVEKIILLIIWPKKA